MRAVWIGLREDDLLCGCESGRDTIESMRVRGALIKSGPLVLQAVRDRKQPLGYGLVYEAPDGPFKMDSARFEPTLQAVRQAFGRKGVGGPLTINIQDIDEPAVPPRALP